MRLLFQFSSVTKFMFRDFVKFYSLIKNYDGCADA